MPSQKRRSVAGSVAAREISKGIFDQLRERGFEASPAQIRKITVKLSETLNYHPRIGVFGKTGVGKSSLCNALFGKKVARVSDVGACTRRPQEVLLKLGEDGSGITLLDVPGVGESRERDEEYGQLYESLLPELDLVIWVLKGDDRAYSVDEAFYNEVVKPVLKGSKTPVLFVLNQVDKIAPFREWDVESAEPSEKQLKNINAKLTNVRDQFKVPATKVAAVSAEEGYGLITLLEKIVRSLPDEKKYGVTREAKKENISEAARKDVQSGIWSTIKRYAVQVFEVALPIVVEKAFKVLAKMIFKF